MTDPENLAFAMSLGVEFTEVAVTAIFVEQASDEDATGDERICFYVYPGDDDGEDALFGKGYTYYHAGEALAHAHKMASNYCVDEIVTC
jgi:hypothetical protein